MVFVIRRFGSWFGVLGLFLTLPVWAISVDDCSRRLPEASLLAHRLTPNPGQALARLQGERDRFVERGVPQEHLPFIRLQAPYADRVVVLLHGIGESPLGMHELANLYFSQGYTVVTVLLDGHGSRPEDLEAATVERWQEQVDDALFAASHLGRRLVLAGFSLGGVLSIDAAFRGRAPMDVLALFSTTVGFNPAIQEMVALRLAENHRWLESEMHEGPMFHDFRYRNMSARAFSSSIQFANRLRQTWENRTLGIPVYVVRASLDKMAEVAAMDAFIQRQGIRPENFLEIRGRHPCTIRASGSRNNQGFSESLVALIRQMGS